MASAYKLSPNQMSAAHVDRAAKSTKPAVGGSLPSASQLGLPPDDPAEQRRAALTVADLTLSHPCQLDPKRGITTCDDDGHAEDVEVVKDLLDAFGLLGALSEAGGPDETWLPTSQAARLLGITEAAVRSRFKKGRLRGAVIGRQRQLRIDPDQVRLLAAAINPEGNQ